MKNKINVLKVGITPCSYTEIAKTIAGAIKTGTTIHIVTANAAMITAAWKDRQLSRCLDEAEMVTADGMSVVWAIRFLGNKAIDRVTGIDAAYKIFKQAEKLGHRIFLLGAAQEVLMSAVKVIQKQFPALILAGFHHGYFKSDTVMVSIIKKVRPDILLVGMGFSMQEKWIYNNKTSLDIPVIMGVGGTFDVISGEIPRAPVWMQKTGLEWLFRLLQEPQRLWKRYLVSNTMFIYNVLKMKLSGKGKWIQ
ncbi:MAG: WecB/TagA/CpsF family glycosyltransferase [Spirochaetales bacterium]|nr:WecB/TagA/CpsF family glycosyltransferase [Spirochaetales bacterium]